MAEMSRFTGGLITDIEHLTQSIADILTTPIGSRVGARDYGCGLSDLLDKPINRQWLMDGFLAIAVAIDRWEPRYDLYKVLLDASQVSGGVILMTCYGLYKPLGKVIVLENITLDFADSADTLFTVSGS